MTDTSIRVRAYATATKVLARVLLPAAGLARPGRGRHLACQWALGVRFPAEDLTGLHPDALAAFTAARTVAFWRDGVLIGLTSGYRDAAEQHRMFRAEVDRTGSTEAARQRVLPPAESSHVRGTALDVRPTEGARWLERHGAAHDLYRIYANEWWHFEYRPEFAGRAPRLLPHPGARGQARSASARAMAANSSSGAWATSRWRL